MFLPKFQYKWITCLHTDLSQIYFTGTTHVLYIYTNAVRLHFTSVAQLPDLDQAGITEEQQPTPTEGKCEIILYVVVRLEGDRQHVRTCRGGYITMPKGFYVYYKGKY